MPHPGTTTDHFDFDMISSTITSSQITLLVSLIQNKTTVAMEGTFHGISHKVPGILDRSGG